MEKQKEQTSNHSQQNKTDDRHIVSESPREPNNKGVKQTHSDKPADTNNPTAEEYLKDKCRSHIKCAICERVISNKAGRPNKCGFCYACMESIKKGGSAIYINKKVRQRVDNALKLKEQEYNELRSYANQLEESMRRDIHQAKQELWDDVIKAFDVYNACECEKFCNCVDEIKKRHGLK